MNGEYRRPAAATDEVVAAVGKVTEAVEWVERVRGRLYDVHQMMGHADALFGEAADALAEAGCYDEAALIRREVVGRNVLDMGRDRPFVSYGIDGVAPAHAV